ncbi:hypothetical protein Ahy_B08g090324 [Arachis hypogaea]|uniref:C2H2-type domain-containing protein n=1 Tax=Arachis hypogaea TaxID=3818 RepID=A0A444Y016_ARAHY|nr:hypothetical protein Ahy_B08g090324 [Arachis hypogaea]
MPKSRNFYIPNHENSIGDGGAIKSFNIILSPLSSPNYACDDTTITITDPHHPLTIIGTNNSELMSEINQLDLNQKLKEKKTGGYDNNDYVNANFIHHALSSSSRGASMSDHAAKEMLKTHQVEHTCPTKESLIWTQQNLKRYDNNFLFKTIDGSSVYEKFFEKVLLKPQGGVGRGIRIVNHNDNSNNKPIRNNINQQHHQHDDLDNNNQKKAIDDAINDGEDGRIQNLPYKKNRPYSCSKCMLVFEISQKFVAHISSHYKPKSKAQRNKRQMAKMMRRSKKMAVLEHQQQYIKNFGGGGGSGLQVNVEDQAHHNNNYDALPGFDVRFSIVKIKTDQNLFYRCYYVMFFISCLLFEFTELKPQGGVGRGIRIIIHNDNNNNKPIRNNINQQHHHQDDPDNNNQKKVIDDVVVNDGEDGRIQSLLYKKNRLYLYTCSKCRVYMSHPQLLSTLRRK